MYVFQFPLKAILDFPDPAWPRLSTELTTKLTSFRQKFDGLLTAQANAMQMEHEPSQPVPQPITLYMHTHMYVYIYINRIYVRHQKAELRKLLCDLTKEDVQLNQVVTRCRQVSPLKICCRLAMAPDGP